MVPPAGLWGLRTRLGFLISGGNLRVVPVFYECDRCTACCRWPGQVRLTDPEIRAIAAFLAISEWDFIQQFARLTPDRHGLALQDKPNGECVFLEGHDCRIQSVKPRQCRAFPNLWNFPGFEKVCKAKHIALSDEEYERRLNALNCY